MSAKFPRGGGSKPILSHPSISFCQILKRKLFEGIKNVRFLNRLFVVCLLVFRTLIYEERSKVARSVEISIKIEVES